MGLDAVEIVMAVEEAFDIRIEDSEGVIIRTPRQLIDLVWSKVAQTDSSVCLSHRAFNRFRELLMRRWPLSRREILPSTRLSNLLLRSQRKELVGFLATDLGAGYLKLTRPTWLSVALFLVAVILGISAALPLRYTSVGMSALFAATVAVGVGFLFAKSTHRFRTEFPKELASVSAMCAWIVAHKPDLATGMESKSGWTREQVALRIREIVVDHLGCEARYSEDALFVEDLGLS